MSFWSKLKSFGSSAFGLGKKIFRGVNSGLGKVNDYSKKFNTIMKHPLTKELGSSLLPDNMYKNFKKYGHIAENYSKQGLDSMKNIKDVGRQFGQVYKDNETMFDRKRPQRNQPPNNSTDRGRGRREPRGQDTEEPGRPSFQGKQKNKQDSSTIERLQKKPETADVEDSGNPYEGLNLL